MVKAFYKIVKGHLIVGIAVKRFFSGQNHKNNTRFVAMSVSFCKKNKKILREIKKGFIFAWLERKAVFYKKLFTEFFF